MECKTYNYDEESQVYCRDRNANFGYNDGDATEEVILNAIRSCRDASTGSEELQQCITNWPTLYHLSPARANLLRPLEESLRGKKVLELGSGCGAISRFLGEIGCELTCVEGSRRRATITASRCRDLENVKVYNDNFQDFETQERFDVVTMIGVLEYSRKFIGGSDPIGTALALARSFLKPDGVLLVAIENKLGLKYWAGAYEDHQGIPFYGIESLYGDGEAVTFGRSDLTRILKQADFSELEFFYPYPDYKLPNLVLSDIALEQPQPLLNNLLSTAFAPVQSASYQRTFSEGAAYRGVVENGLVGDLANSFLIVAKKGLGNWSNNQHGVAYIYSQFRRRELSKEVSIHREGDALQVHRRLLAGAVKKPAWMRFPESEPLVDGELHFNSLLTLVNRERWNCSHLVQWMGPLLQVLLKYSHISGERLVLSGKYFDATPFNLIVDASGEAVLFDLEWSLWPEIELALPLFRGLFHSLARVGTVAKPETGTSLNLVELAAQVISNLIDQPLDIDAYLAKEAEFQGLISGRSSSLDSFKAAMLEVRMSPTRLRESLQQAEHTISELKGQLVNFPENKPKSFQRKGDVAFITEMQDLVKQAMNSSSYTERRYIEPSLRKELEINIKLLGRDLELSTAMGQCLEMLKTTLNHDDYQQWIAKHELREVDAEILAERMMLHWHVQPMMHCFMFVLPGEESLLADTIDSLAAQLYKGWQLTVIAASPAPDPIFGQANFLHWRTLSQEDPYAVLNQEIAAVPAHWISFIEPGMQYSQHSLAKIADNINLNPAGSFFYTDDDQVDNSGIRCYPRFKPDFNLDLLRSSPYIGNSWVPAGHLQQLGGIQALPGAENYDLALRWFDVFGESAFVHIADVLTHKSNQVDRPFDAKAGEVALKQHFERRQIPAEIGPGYVENSYRVTYLHAAQPKVSIIIPTKDKLEFFQPCIESLLDKTSYPNYEVLVVDNQSSDPDTLAYYEKLTVTYAGKVRVLFFDKPFNFSGMNNWAAEQASGDYLLLLNNDTEIIQPEWLERMMNHGQRKDVGVVGARLIYPESGRIQHAGVVLGLSEIADHPFNDVLSLNESSHMERARMDQNYSAVTAAVMLVKRDIYMELGGMDADNLAVLFNDVDFCLRVGERGYRIVWTPYAMAIHHGSSSLKPSQMSGFYFDAFNYAERTEKTRKEQRYMLNTWLPILANDPAYNKNLSLRKREYEIDLNAPQNWDIEHHLRLRVYGIPISGGSGDYRVKQPFLSLAKSGMALCEFGKGHINLTELKRLQPDTVVVQNAISDNEIELLQFYREFKADVQIVFMLDDLLHDLPEKSSQYRKMKAAYRDARTRLRKVLGYCDRLIVSTQPLADMCSDMIQHIDIIPNRLQSDKWLGLQSLRQQSDKPRVGWAGAQQHQGDLELIIDVVKETANEIDWVFFGMCPDEIKPYIKEEHDFVNIDVYPQKLASLNLDLAVAPLEDHDFNIAKSNLRLLEYGILGWPVVCSDIYPYKTNNAPVIRVANNKAAWLAAIRQILADPAALQQASDDLKQWVKQHYVLENHLNEWMEALATPEFTHNDQNRTVTGEQALRG